MNRFFLKSAVLLLPTLLSATAWANPQQSASITDSEPKSSAEAAVSSAPVAGHVFAFPVATKSIEAQKLVEVALDQYENVLLEDSAASARKATEKDPQFALAYAMWSFAARRSQPSPQAAQKAEQLAVNAAPEERLLVNFLTAVQKDDMLPAITSMNDLLARFPKDRHALYVTAEWLYFQQDYDRSVKLMEQIIKLDSNFAPAFNMLGYAKVESGDPDPGKALAYVKRYAELEPGQPNPEDSIGEVSRYAGDDRGSNEHYRAALRFSPAFITSQTGLGDTYSLMHDFSSAAAEYDKALAMSTNNRDRLHVEFQKALMKFWAGRPAEGLQALAAAEQKAHGAHEPYSEFEIQQASAQLALTLKQRIAKLQEMERIYSYPVKGMGESDRNPSLASIWRDQVRVQVEQNHVDATAETIRKIGRASCR